MIEGVLSTVDFIDFETCMNCIKGNQTHKSKKGATKSKHLLGIIHIDIYCLDKDKIFLHIYWSFLVYLCVLHSKDEGLKAFKVFKVEVEKQCHKEIKVVNNMVDT